MTRMRRSWLRRRRVSLSLSSQPPSCETLETLHINSQTDSSLEVFKGASREYYQVRLAYYGRTGQAHHALRHFARDYGSCLEERLQIFAEPPRANFVNFKLLSYED